MLTLEERDRVLAEIPWPKRGVFLALSWTGARPSEARVLRVKDWDGDGWIHVRQAAKDRKTEGVRRGTKKRREKMLAVEAPEFARWLGEHVPKDRRLGEPMAPLFSNPDAIKATKGTRVPLGWWSETALHRTWTDACRRAGAPAVSLYAGTKHTLGTALKDRGVDDATLAELFGHADQRSVRPYRLIRPSAVRGALRRLEE